MKQYIQHGLPDFSKINSYPCNNLTLKTTKPLAPSDMVNLPGNVIIGLLRFISTLDDFVGLGCGLGIQLHQETSSDIWGGEWLGKRQLCPGSHANFNT